MPGYQGGVVLCLLQILFRGTPHFAYPHAWWRFFQQFVFVDPLGRLRITGDQRGGDEFAEHEFSPIIGDTETGDAIIAFRASACTNDKV